MPAPSLCRIRAILLLFPTLMAPLAAQHVLLAEYSGKMYPVRAASGLRPCVERDGRVVSISTRGFALAEAPEYLPAFVSVRDVYVHNTSLTSDGVGSLNNTFYFNATFESRYHLKDVFLVLELDTEEAGKMIFLREVGDLKPSHETPVSAIVPMSYPLGSGSYHLHLFSGGVEVLQSEIPFDEREAALDRMVAKRIENVQSAAPALFVGPAPSYPAGLKKANVKGRATISIRIGANGAVYDPAIKNATDPAFGKEALAAVRLWRFLPKVKDGRPVETMADVPINFDLPNPPKGQP